MTWPQRAVNLLYAFRDFAPLTNILALLVLPLALLPSAPTDEFSTISLSRPISLSLLRRLFLLAFVANKVHYFVVYNHVGISRVWNFQSNEIWAAPCKPPFQETQLSMVNVPLPRNHTTTDNQAHPRHGLPLLHLPPPCRV